MKVKFRNKDCKDCPQNEREDIVWNKGLQDGIELGKKITIEKIYKFLKKG